MTTALDQIKEEYITEQELADLFGVTPERIRDLRSNHNTGRAEFIPSHKVTSKRHLYHIKDVMSYIVKKRVGTNFRSQISDKE